MIPRERLIATIFVLPACLLVALFVFWPAISMARSSFCDQKLTDRQLGEFTGRENYSAVWNDPDFRQAARNTAWFTILVVPLQTVLALLLAVWTNRPGLSNKLLRIAIFIPTTISLTVLAILWKILYEPATATGSGLFNGLLTAINQITPFEVASQPFLTSPTQAMYCIVAMSIWQGVGFQMMIFLAGLQTIDRQLYESAALDGARRWQSFRHVTIPGIAPTAVLVVMITTIFALKLFVQPYLMTGGGPQGSTISVVQYIYEAAFSQRDLGLACAAGVVFFVSVTAIAALQRLLLRSTEVAQ